MLRNIEYARYLIVEVLKREFAPATPRSHLTQCLRENEPEEREQGMKAGLKLLRSCDFVLLGDRYGISEGMKRELQEADRLGIKVTTVERLHAERERDTEDIEQKRRVIVDYAQRHACKFCRGTCLHSCTSYCCQEPYIKAYEYAKKHYDKGEIRE